MGIARALPEQEPTHVNEMKAEAATFFDQFAAAFRSFDGAVIAQRYLAPCWSVQADGSYRCLATSADVAAYFQTVLDGYRQEGCRSCRYRELEVLAVGAHCALASVTWELLAADGRIVSRWRESYHLLRTGGALRVFATVDHAEPAPA